MTELPREEDAEVTTSPVFDPSLPSNEQGKTFLGKTSSASSWPGDIDPVPKRTIPLTVTRAANPFFADFQPQNSSVFSLFDSLDHTDGYKLCDVKVSYTIFGYHADWTRDPLYGPIEGQSAFDRLKACGLTCDLKDYAYTSVDKTRSINASQLTDPSKNNQQDTIGSLRTICHGSMFDLNFRQLTGEKDWLKYPGDDIQKKFVTSHPLSVGTNAMDALFGWLRAQDGDQSELRKHLMKLQTFVLDTNDDLDSQLQAEDMLSTNNFISIPGGTEWHFAQPDKQPGNSSTDTAPIVPSADAMRSLQKLNNLQGLLDAFLRQRDRFKRDIFDIWWKCLCSKDRETFNARHAFSELRRYWSEDFGRGDYRINELQTALKPLREALNVQMPIYSTKTPDFVIQQDPTLLVSGTSSGWPQNFNDDLAVRLPGQEMFDPVIAKVDFPKYLEFQDLFRQKMSYTIFDASSRLLFEAAALRDRKTTTNSLGRPPLYYNDKDRFTGDNGWFPLYIEWEAEYYHIPFDKWEFKACGPESRYGYCLKEDVDLSTLSSIREDYRIISGRTPLLPQAAANLESTLRQVFSKINPDQLNGIMDSLARDQLLADVRSLEYLSAPMSGFTDQLTTRQQGTHFSPASYHQGGDNPVVVPEAKVVEDIIPLTDADFLIMDGSCTTTPYATLADMPSDTARISPFKPCTHGQFKFTKFNIMDRFGQVVDGIRTTIDSSGKKSQNPLFPCLGDSYSVQELQTQAGKANTVIQREDGLNSFVQLPPSINQHARINAHYVTVDTATKNWRRIQEWQNPVKGWLVVDYANTSIQIFSTDGTFVREYNVVGGNINTRPFSSDASASAKLDPLMNGLLSQFGNPAYLLRLFQNISQTIDATQASPSHYVESMVSILGKPLALVTCGYSMQVAQAPLTNQYGSVLDYEKAPSASVTDYNFSIKLGDKDNVFDGLFGLFGNRSGSTFDFTKFQCYHDPEQSKRPQLQTLKPFYMDVTDASHTNPVEYDYMSYEDNKLNIFAALVDPFTPINIYSALLPVKQLSIPPWCLASGIGRIASFFKTGPILLANDIPTYDSSKDVSKDYTLDALPQPNGSIAIPAVTAADWRWLQPYAQSDGSTKYNALGVQTPSTKPLWETPPYVITEGYLQMAKPFTAPNKSAKNANTV